MKTLNELMSAGKDAAICLSAANSAPLTYAQLRSLAQYVQTEFNRIGIGRNDRVALVLPNGADMASSFITVASC
ncbi:MAG: AMP-dependent synthetase, partial [Betaproteobacteria bacterium]|nr:AMP-dependent synthetase [Betaproteobacteria bacterium]